MKQKQGPHQFIQISNGLTYLSVFSGLFAIAMMLAEYSIPLTIHFAGIALVVSTLADLFDGRFARLFRRTSEECEFGVQLDSLADAVVFGVCPVVVAAVFLRGEQDFQWLLYSSLAIYVICSITRLGYFNLKSVGTGEFVGIPTTLTNLVWSLLFLFPPSIFATVTVALLLGVLMVSPFKVPRPGKMTLLGLVLVSAALIASHLFSVF